MRVSQVVTDGGEGSNFPVVPVGWVVLVLGAVRIEIEVGILRPSRIMDLTCLGFGGT